jgi:pimeloyl-ACP methyl ester carboxylesterase
MSSETAIVDYMEAGAGPVVVLIHASTSGARQWRLLITGLEDRYHLIAVNMMGYGRTPAWAGPRPQTLNDHVRAIMPALPGGDQKIHLVGHSLGGAVAMMLAKQLGDRVEKLILLEPNPFYLLRDHGRDAAYAEIKAVSDDVRHKGDAGRWDEAAENFGDYWSRPGYWASLHDNLRASFIENLRNNYFEWEAVLDSDITLDDWRDALPEQTLVVSARDTTRPILEIVELMREACPAWDYVELPEGGHMAPMSHPQLVNPIIANYLDNGLDNGQRNSS